MQRITICPWNVSYFQSAFNSFPNMTHCGSQARGSDVEGLEEGGDHLPENDTR